MALSSPSKQPLADRMRPDSPANIVGQTHLLDKGRILQQLLQSGNLPSLLLWGPPGCGKTTLAAILAKSTTADFVFFSAVLSGVKDIRRIVAQAREQKDKMQQATVLFVDEIHRFNKSQQDAFLPHVESGLITLIGATTENPSFQVIAPLLSRCQVLVLQSLTKEEIQQVLLRALHDTDKGLGSMQLKISDEALTLLSAGSDGDCRRALNSLEIAANLAGNPTGEVKAAGITKEHALEALGKQTLRYDMDGEEHYNLISALHKSLRDSDPDGALYWLTRMLEAGEEPLYIARRLIRFASEDIGNADPMALQVALNCRDAYHMLGSPEGELALTQAVIYLATAPKSNALYVADKKVRKTIRRSGSLGVPLHLRNAPTKLMQDLNYGKGYRYAHDAPDGLVLQDHLPEQLHGHIFYQPSKRGYEAVIGERLQKWRKILEQRNNNQKKQDNAKKK